MKPNKDEYKIPTKEELLQNFKKFFEEYAKNAADLLNNLQTCGNNLSILAREESANFNQYVQSYREYFSLLDKYYKDSKDKNSFYTGQNVGFPGVVDEGNYDLSEVKTDNEKFQMLKDNLEAVSAGNEKYINQLTDTLMFARNYQKKFVETQSYLNDIIEKYKDSTK